MAEENSEKNPYQNEKEPSIPRKPLYVEYYPCIHRWLRKHPKPSSPSFLKPFLRPSEDRINFLATPVARRLVEVWLGHSHHLAADMKSRLLEMLYRYGFTHEILEAMLEAQRLERERLARIAAAGPFDVLDEDGNPITPNWVFKPFGQKKKKRRKKISNVWKPGKPGQLKPGWPHQTGLELLMLLLNYPTPDEEYISKIRAYFEVQAQILHRIVAKILDPFYGNEEWPFSSHSSIAMGCLVFCVWIAKNIIVPAEAIADEDVELCLSWKGQIPPKLRPKKVKPSKGRKKKRTKKARKLRKSKKRQKPRKVMLDAQVQYDEDFLENPSEEKISEPLRPEQISFLCKSLWYNPLVPEFFFEKLCVPEKCVEFEKIFETETWKLTSVADFPVQPMIPNPVPIFHHNLRPVIGCCHSDSDTPWFIMSDPKSYDEDQINHWDTAFTLETFGMVVELIKNLISIETLSRDRMLELISEICDAIKINKIDTDVSPEIEILDAKRTIMFERIFIQMFSTKFRDFDENTCGYMEIICSRAAELVRFLYQQTAHELWKFQHSPPPTPPTPEPEDEPYSDFDEELFEKWNHWLGFLLKSSQIWYNWKFWLLNVTKSETLPKDRSELIEEAENWLEVGQKTQIIAEDYKSEAKIGLESISASKNRLEDCQCEGDVEGNKSSLLEENVQIFRKCEELDQKLAFNFWKQTEEPMIVNDIDMEDSNTVSSLIHCEIVSDPTKNDEILELSESQLIQPQEEENAKKSCETLHIEEELLVIMAEIYESVMERRKSVSLKEGEGDDKTLINVDNLSNQISLLIEKTEISRDKVIEQITRRNSSLAISHQNASTDESQQESVPKKTGSKEIEDAISSQEKTLIDSEVNDGQTQSEQSSKKSKIPPTLEKRLSGSGAEMNASESLEEELLSKKSKSPSPDSQSTEMAEMEDSIKTPSSLVESLKMKENLELETKSIQSISAEMSEGDEIVPSHPTGSEKIIDDSEVQEKEKSKQLPEPSSPLQTSGTSEMSQDDSISTTRKSSLMESDKVNDDSGVSYLDLEIIAEITRDEFNKEVRSRRSTLQEESIKNSLLSQKSFVSEETGSVKRSIGENSSNDLEPALEDIEPQLDDFEEISTKSSTLLEEKVASLRESLRDVESSLISLDSYEAVTKSPENSLSPREIRQEAEGLINEEVKSHQSITGEEIRKKSQLSETSEISFTEGTETKRELMSITESSLKSSDGHEDMTKSPESSVSPREIPPEGLINQETTSRGSIQEEIRKKSQLSGTSEKSFIEEVEATGSEYKKDSIATLDSEATLPEEKEGSVRESLRDVESSLKSSDSYEDMTKSPESPVSPREIPPEGLINQETTSRRSIHDEIRKKSQLSGTSVKSFFEETETKRDSMSITDSSLKSSDSHENVTKPRISSLTFREMSREQIIELIKSRRNSIASSLRIDNSRQDNTETEQVLQEETEATDEELTTSRKGSETDSQKE